MNQNDRIVIADALTPSQRAMKRTLDILVALVALALVGWVIIPAMLWVRRESGGTGIFRQPRIGRGGRLFHIYKLRTMHAAAQMGPSVTSARDPRITRGGSFLRRWKIDELPQLWNVLRGDMSLVGPRPEVPAYLSRIRREAPLVLSVRPGITGPATIKYRREEQLLASVPDPQAFSDDVLFPDKLRINDSYVRYYNFFADLKYLWVTVVPRRQTSTSAFVTPLDGKMFEAA
jgi:lipopolysaccharide/colanic/teichoic acid biosynthesis glycosyltransferase